jgi:hypothetical protein
VLRLYTSSEVVVYVNSWRAEYTHPDMDLVTSSPRPNGGHSRSVHQSFICMNGDSSSTNTYIQRKLDYDIAQAPSDADRVRSPLQGIWKIKRL